MNNNPKICKNCGNSFTPSKNDHRIKFCSEKCRNVHRTNTNYMSKYYENNRAKWVDRQNSESCKALKNKSRRIKYASDAEYRNRIKMRSNQYRKANPNVRINNDLKKYGLTLDCYNKMLELQGFKCAICGRTDSGDSQSKRLYVDHDHATGRVRGLLCSQCNMGLGKFFDNTDFLRNAITYLEENHE